MRYGLSQGATEFVETLHAACDEQDIRNSLDVEVYASRTFVVLLAVAKNAATNVLVPIPAPKGISVSGYAFDGLNGCYRVSCAHYLRLGQVPLSYRLSIFRSAGRWDTFVPMPETVLLRHMSQEQLDLVTQFKGTYGDTDFDFEYLQVVL